MENEKLQIPEDELTGAIMTWINMESYDNRFAKKANEKRPKISELSSKKTEENQISLMYNIIQILKNQIGEFEKEDDLKSYLQEKGFNEKFSLNKEELSKFLSLNKKQIGEYLGGSINNSKIYDLLKNMYNSTDYFKEHLGATGDGDLLNIFYKIDNNSMYDYRIYINTPISNKTEEFLNEYIQRCFAKKNPYNMKGMFNSSNVSKDNTILYIKDEDLEATIEVLKQIGNERKDLIDYFGTPILLSGECPEIPLNKGERWYGFTNAGKTKNLMTYNSVISRDIDMAIMNALYKSNDEIRKKMQDNLRYNLNSFENFRNIKINKDFFMIMTFGNLSEEDILKFKNDNKDSINNTLREIMSDSNRKNKFINLFNDALIDVSSIRKFEREDAPRVLPWTSEIMYEKDNKPKMKMKERNLSPEKQKEFSNDGKLIIKMGNRQQDNDIER